MTVFLVVATCRLVEEALVARKSETANISETGKRLPDYTTQHPRRQSSSNCRRENLKFQQKLQSEYPIRNLNPRPSECEKRIPNTRPENSVASSATNQRKGVGGSESSALLFHRFLSSRLPLKKVPWRHCVGFCPQWDPLGH